MTRERLYLFDTTLRDGQQTQGVQFSTAEKVQIAQQYLVPRQIRENGLRDGEMTFTDDALKAIASKAIERKTGARGLRSIMEDILLDTMFELPGLDSVTEVVVNEEAVTSEAKPLTATKSQPGSTFLESLVIPLT